MINILYSDNDVIVCIKPSGVLATDEEDGMPSLINKQLNTNLDIKTVHRLDRVTSGLMVYAIGQKNAANLSKQIVDKSFQKKYLTIVHGKPVDNFGTYNDLLFRDKQKNMTFPVKRLRKGVRDASLNYYVLDSSDEMSLCEIELITGRTHQVRVQFSSRNMPVFGDTKYGAAKDNCQLALWSYSISFNHPMKNIPMTFSELPPRIWPWNVFDKYTSIRPQDEYELKERKIFRENLYMMED